MLHKLGLMVALSLVLVSCEHENVTESPTGQSNIKLRKITQRFGVAPQGLDLNHVSFGIFHYDSGGNMVKYEFFHGSPGAEKRTIYEDFTYEDDRLVMTEHYIFYDNQFIKSRVEEYEYDDQGRLKITKTRNWSEITETWQEGSVVFRYSKTGQLIEMEAPEWSLDSFIYDSRDNLSRHENHPFFASDYTGAIVKTFTYDTQPNPFYRLTDRFWLPLGNGASASGFLLSPNNVLSWDGYSPQTGGVIAKGALEFEYNADGYPVRAFETVTSPLTDPNPGVIYWLTEYEYLR